MVQTTQALKKAFPNCEVKSQPAKKSGGFEISLTTPEGKSSLVYSKLGGDGRIKQEKVETLFMKIKDTL